MSRLFVRASSQHISIATQVATGLPVTIAAWVYPVTLPAVAWISMSLGTTNNYFGIVALSTGVVRGQLDNGSGGALIVPSAAGALTTGAWHHVAVHFATAGTFLYVNGVGVNSGAGGVFPTTSTHSAGRNPAGTDHWDGRIADYAIWTTDITAGEIAGLARGGSPLRVKPRSLALYWPMWGIASPETDFSLNARHGTVTGATAANHAPVGPPVPFVR